MKIKPLADRVLVKNDKAETKTASGLIIPEAAQEKTQTAVVVEVGPGTDENKITVKKGDRIMYDKYAGTQVKIDGEDHLILRMSDIIAVIERQAGRAIYRRFSACRIRLGDALALCHKQACPLQNTPSGRAMCSRLASPSTLDADVCLDVADSP